MALKFSEGTCSGCPSRWTGFNRAHCAGCHETFSVVSNFDKHRSGSKCRPPATVGLVLDDAVWHMPDSR